jgi:hypothetical protein
VRSSFSSNPGTLITQEPDVEAAIISGVDHDLTEARVTVVGVPTSRARPRPSSARCRRRGQHRHDRAERVRRHGPHRHLLHAPEGRPAGGDEKLAELRPQVASRRCCPTSTSARCRWSARA